MLRDDLPNANGITFCPDRLFADEWKPFAGIAAGSDGTLYLPADAEGSVLALQQHEPTARLAAVL